MTPSDPFPKGRGGKLMPPCSKNWPDDMRMQAGDAIFFYQCLLPICDPVRSRVPNDPRPSF